MAEDVLRTELLRLLREDPVVQAAVLQAAMAASDREHAARRAEAVERAAQVAGKRSAKRAADAAPRH